MLVISLLLVFICFNWSSAIDNPPVMGFEMQIYCPIWETVDQNDTQLPWCADVFIYEDDFPGYHDIIFHRKFCTNLFKIPVHASTNDTGPDGVTPFHEWTYIVIHNCTIPEFKENGEPVKKCQCSRPKEDEDVAFNTTKTIYWRQVLNLEDSKLCSIPNNRSAEICNWNEDTEWIEDDEAEVFLNTLDENPTWKGIILASD